MTPYDPCTDRYSFMPCRRSGRSGLILPELSIGLWHNFGSIDSFDNAAAMLRAASWGYDVLPESRIKRGPAVRQSFSSSAENFFEVQKNLYAVFFQFYQFFMGQPKSALFS